MADTQEILRRAIDAQVLAATETAKNDIQLAAIGFLREIGAEVGRTVQNAVHNHLDETVSELKKQMAVVTKEAEIAQNKLIRGLSEAKTRVDEVQPQAKWEIFAYGLVGSAIGSIAMVIAISFGGIHIS